VVKGGAKQTLVELFCFEATYAKIHGMNTHSINIDPEILGGTPVFAGTRVPVESLFDHLENGVSLDEFLEDFPTVDRQQAVDVLELAQEILTSNKFAEIYETIA